MFLYLDIVGLKSHKKWDIGMPLNVVKGGKGLDRDKGFNLIRLKDGLKRKMKLY